jgi:sialate O-acetylesterase
MVLQRQQPIRIWGWAKPGEQVSVQLGDLKLQTTKASSTGSWLIELPAQKEGGPFKIQVSATEKIVIEDVWIGEVWIASGQSNMEWRMEDLGPAYQSEIQSASNSRIRMIKVEKQPAVAPLDHFQTQGWKVANPQNVKDFSAVAWYFARKIQQQLKVPVGIINNNWGGTPAEVWVSPSGLSAFPHYSQQIETIRAQAYADYKDFRLRRNAVKKAKLDSLLQRPDAGYFYTTEKLKSGQGISFKPGMKTGRLWEQQMLPDFDGVVFLRKSIRIPEGMDKSRLRLHLGKIDDSDSTFVNGKLAGTNRIHNAWRKYGPLPVSGNELSILIRVEDNGGGGGLWGEPDSLYLEDGTRRISLGDDWEYLPGVNLKKYDVKPIGEWDWPVNASGLYFGQIHPVQNFNIRGAIWYQGESNVGRAEEYAKLLPALILDWRRHFRNPEMPFLFVQLANYLDPQTGPEESAWAELRWAQYQTLSLPHTGMATAIDLGEANDIHPKRKKEVGERLAGLALRDPYKASTEEVEGPCLSKAEVKGPEMILQFNHASGLKTRDGGSPESLYLAGADKVWKKAEARIEGNKLILRAPGISQPIHVRYAWADNPDRANLINAAGLPMLPFQTRKP